MSGRSALHFTEIQVELCYHVLSLSARGGGGSIFYVVTEDWKEGERERYNGKCMFHRESLAATG